MLDALLGPDPLDPVSAQAPVFSAANGLNKPVAGLRIWVLPQAERAHVAPGVLKAYDLGLEQLAALGVQLIEQSLPTTLEQCMRIAGGLMSAEGYASLGSLFERDDLRCADGQNFNDVSFANRRDFKQPNSPNRRLRSPAHRRVGPHRPAERRHPRRSPAADHRGNAGVERLRQPPHRRTDRTLDRRGGGSARLPLSGAPGLPGGHERQGRLGLRQEHDPPLPARACQAPRHGVVGFRRCSTSARPTKTS